MFLKKTFAIVFSAVMLMSALPAVYAEEQPWVTIVNETRQVTIDTETIQYPGTRVNISVWLPDYLREQADGSYSPDDIAAYIGEATVDEYNKINKTFKLRTNALSGRYTVNLWVQGEGEVREGSFDYQDVVRAAQILEITQNGSGAQIRAIFDGDGTLSLNSVDVASYKTYSTYGDAKRNYVANNIAQDRPADLADLQSKVQREIRKLTMTEALISSDRATAKTMLEENGELFMLGNMAEYNNLNSSATEKFYSELLSLLKDCLFPEDVSESFAKALEIARAQPRQAESSKPVGSNSSGRKSAVTMADTAITAPEEKAEAVSAFSDLDDAAWAATPIIVLYERGIVKGKTENEFFPNDLLKREELIEIIVRAFDIKAASVKELPFEDVSRDDWFYESVRRAEQRGVIKGISATEFGVGEYVTRQDMAVMVVNALEVSGKHLEPKEEKTAFADSAEIAEYAEAAVTALHQAGIVNGRDDKHFDPLGTATRAEAAKIIYAILYRFNML